MFDLKKSLAEWRRQMLAAGIQTPVPLEELESHLREEIERQIKSGLNDQEAFRNAVTKIGQARTLKVEFKKAGIPAEMRLVQLAGIACGMVAGLFSLWILCVSLFIHETNWVVRTFGLLAVTLIILSCGYGDRFLPAIRHPAVRTAIGFACCLTSFGGMILFIKFVLPHLFDVPARADFPANQLLVSFLGAWAAAAILGAVAYRLEKAARKNTERYV